MAAMCLEPSIQQTVEPKQLIECRKTNGNCTQGKVMGITMCSSIPLAPSNETANNAVIILDNLQLQKRKS